MSEVEYNALLFQISGKLDKLNELPNLIFMCRGKIAEDRKSGIQNVLELFNELERKRNLGIDNFEVLKTVLEQMKRKGKTLLKKVEDFEKKRKVMSVGIIPSVKQAAGKVVGAIKMICNFRTIAGGLLVVNCGMVLHSCSSLEEFTDSFNKVVLVAATQLILISQSSICFTVRAENLTALKALWDSYQDGTLRQRLQEFLVTEEIKRLSDGQEAEVIVDIDEQEYKETCLDLMIFETEASGVDQEGRSSKKCRRNSDSTLYLKPMETEVMSMSLKQAENKFSFERQIRQNLEKENENLSAKLMEARSVVAAGPSVEQSIESVSELQKVPFTLKQRRSSDSTPYYKSKEAKLEQEMEYSNEELNYFRICYITTNIIREGLRSVFKQEWNTRYQASLGDWQDTAKNGVDFVNQETPASKERIARWLTMMRNGNTKEWEIYALFFGILNSMSIGASLNPAISNHVKALRVFRNQVFCHNVEGRISSIDFQRSVAEVETAFVGLNLAVDGIRAIANQNDFPTKEVNNLKETIATLEKKYAALEEKSAALEEKITSLEEKSSALEEKST